MIREKEYWCDDRSISSRLIESQSYIIQNYFQKIPELYRFVELVFSVAVHIIDNEHLHKIRKALQTTSRNSLKIETMDKVLRIMYNSPDLDQKASMYEFVKEILEKFVFIRNRQGLDDNIG